MPEDRWVTVALTVAGLAVWSVLVGERVREAVLRRVARWVGAGTLQEAVLRAGALQLAGLMVLSAWCVCCWLLGAALGVGALTRTVLLLAALAYGPLAWAQLPVLPGGRQPRQLLEDHGVPAAHAPAVAGFGALCAVVTVVVLVSLGAPSLWADPARPRW